MKNLDKMMQAAIAGVLALAAAQVEAAPVMEKCYGIAKAQLNDCQTSTASCSGSATKDNQADAFLLVPKGLCLKIVGGKLSQKAATETSRKVVTINPKITAGNYVMDPSHSTVLWHIDHLGFSDYSGKWFVQEGKINLDEKHPENSSVNVVIQIKDVITGNPELDEHLHGPSFFDVSRYPTATFVSKKVVLTGKESADVYGDLTLHNVTKPIVLKMQLNKAAINPITNKPEVGFTGSAELKRSDYGMTSLLPLLGDKVKIDLNAEAYADQR